VVGRAGPFVRAASYPSYGEAFQRQVRPDFVNLFEAVAQAAWRDLYVNRIGAYRDLLK